MMTTLRALCLFAVIPFLSSCGGGGGDCSTSLGAIGGAICGSSSSNTAPVANPGLTQNVAVGVLVTLDGSGSRDADNEQITYLWELTSKPAGSGASLTSATSAKPEFTADVAGTYTIALVVNDGKASSTRVSVSVYASVTNSAPVANPGVNQNVPLGTVITLDGTASTDANFDTLSYRWVMLSKPTGSAAALSSNTSPNPKFTADVMGIYSIALVVNDGRLDSLPAAVTVIASSANSAPVANAGVAQSVVEGSQVTLDGTASSDSNNDPLSFKWSWGAKPTGSVATLSLATSAKPTFTADVAGTYVVTLVVNDGRVDSTVAAVTVTASVVNSAPVANPGVAQSVVAGGLVTLDGTASSDSNNDPLSFKWSWGAKPTGSVATLSLATSAKPTFTADVAGTYVVTLVVNDGRVDSPVTAVTVTASVVNSAPVANAGSNQNVTLGSLVTLDGSLSSDANRDLLSYKWTMVSKPSSSSATLSSSTSPSPTFTADLAGVYVLSLVVNDGKVDSPVVAVTITSAVANSAPVSNAGANQNLTVGVLATLDGTGSTDADRDLLTYFWTLISKPSGSSATLSSATSPMPTITPDVTGTYVASLVVNDGKVSSSAAATTLTAAVVNSAPVANAGVNQNVTTGSTVTLVSSGSTDANGDTLTYRWSMASVPSTSSAALSSSTVASPTFTADVSGTYVVNLIVNDGKVNSTNVGAVTITASAANSTPVASAGSNQTVTRTGSPAVATVTLDGTGSTDANGDTLTYLWALTSKPTSSTASLSSTTASSPTFVADIAGVYVATLIVNDGKVSSSVSTVAITAN